MGLLKSGDHIIASRGLFGSTQTFFNAYMGKFGVETTFVSATDLVEYEAAVRPSTKLVFVETPSNPLTQLVDIAAVSAIAKKAGAWLAVDNCFCTPALQKPLELGADLVIHSATKYLDGQGRVMGGAVVGSKAMLEEVYKFLRTAGPSISPFNAWVILKGLETLRIRMEAQSSSALAIAQWLEAQPGIERVFYPGLESHPQHALALQQQKSGGAIVAFEGQRRRQGRRMARSGFNTHVVDHGKPWRHAQHHHASWHNDAWPYQCGGARGSGDPRQLAASCCGPGVGGRHQGRSGARA